MGDQLDPGAGRLPAQLLQHRPHARRRHDSVYGFGRLLLRALLDRPGPTGRRVGLLGNLVGQFKLELLLAPDHQLNQVKRGQAEVALNLFVFPARTDVALPTEFTRFTVVPDTPYTMDPSTIAEHREEWVDAWTATVVR